MAVPFGTPLKEKSGDDPVHHLKLAENAKLWVDVSKAKPKIAAERSNLIAHLRFVRATKILSASGRYLIETKLEPIGKCGRAVRHLLERAVGFYATFSALPFCGRSKTLQWSKSNA